MNAFGRPTALAQLILRQVIREGDVVIDATAGNGHDTEFLANAVGECGRVLAFDVQAAAIEATRARLDAAGLSGRVELFQESHEGIAAQVAAGSVTAVMFNLGYLPGQDHGLVTRKEGTLVALEAAAGVLKAGGVLSVICYPGHEGGDEEADAVGAWFAEKARQRWNVTRHGAVGTLRPAPFLLMGISR